MPKNPLTKTRSAVILRAIGAMEEMHAEYSEIQDKSRARGEAAEAACAKSAAEQLTETLLQTRAFLRTQGVEV